MGQESHSNLYTQITQLRRKAALLAFILVLMHQYVEHAYLFFLPRWQHFWTQVLFYGLAGPLLAWLALTSLRRQVLETERAVCASSSLVPVSALADRSSGDPHRAPYVASVPQRHAIGMGLPAISSCLLRRPRKPVSALQRSHPGGHGHCRFAYGDCPRRGNDAPGGAGRDAERADLH